MKTIGIDLDNTIIIYDNLFRKLAVEKEIIENMTEAGKKEIREILKTKSREDEFTIMQGEVYGKRIIEAEPAKGVKKALSELKKRGYKLRIISHKTKYPIRGPRVNLRESALLWIENNLIDEEGKQIIPSKDIYFESSIEEKIYRIKALRCDYFIDDLIKVIKQIPNTIHCIHYLPRGIEDTQDRKITRISCWSELTEII